MQGIHGCARPSLQAMSKNGEYIGERYVRLLHVPRAEMDEQVGVHGAGGALFQASTTT